MPRGYKTNRKTKKRFPTNETAGYDISGGRNYSIFGVQKGDNLKDWDIGLPYDTPRKKSTASRKSSSRKSTKSRKRRDDLGSGSVVPHGNIF